MSPWCHLIGYETAYKLFSFVVGIILTLNHFFSPSVSAYFDLSLNVATVTHLVVKLCHCTAGSSTPTASLPRFKEGDTREVARFFVCEWGL